MRANILFLVITGTDPSARKGGIGFAMPGYLTAINNIGLDWISIPTYHPSAKGGRFRLWLMALPKLYKNIYKYRYSGETIVVYSHAGAGLSLLREGIVLLLARLCGAVTVIQLHALEVDRYLCHPLKRFLFKLSLSFASIISVLTPWWKERLLEQGVNTPIFVIPNPLPPSWEDIARLPLSQCSVKKSELTILTMTRIEPGKGVDLLVETMSLLPKNVRLLVAGDGSQLPRLKARASELNLCSQISFMGWVTGQPKQDLLEKADIFCLPSTYDSFGMGFLEAMANGLPVVALAWGPIADVVANGRCGFLVDERKTDLLADAIVRLMDPVLRHEMSIEAKKWVLENFAAEKVGGSLKEMFEKLVGDEG